MASPSLVSKIGLGADGLGVELKNELVTHLRENGIEVVDIGVTGDEQIDYPDVGSKLAQRLVAGDFERGVLVCGTGAGMAIAANKVPGVRAVCVADPYTAERAIASNNAQVITFGAQITGLSVAKMLLDIYLSNEFQGGRSAPKVAKLEQLDQDR